MRPNTNWPAVGKVDVSKGGKRNNSFGLFGLLLFWIGNVILAIFLFAIITIIAYRVINYFTPNNVEMEATLEALVIQETATASAHLARMTHQASEYYATSTVNSMRLTGTPSRAPTPLRTPMPSPSPSLIPTSTTTITAHEQVEVKGIVVTASINTEVYAGPSIFRGVRALFQDGDLVVILTKTTDGEWYYVKRESDRIEGWIKASVIHIEQGDDANVPVTWPPSLANDNEQADTVTNAACISVVVERDFLGTVHIKWSDFPDETRWLYLTVRGLLNGEMTDLIQPNNKIDITDRDMAENGFELGSYLFDPDDPSSKGFPTGTIFNYTLLARNASLEALCAVSGSFQ